MRSGFDGPWTADPLQFDNSYYVNLMTLDWTPRSWDGPLQVAYVVMARIVRAYIVMALDWMPRSWNGPLQVH